MPDLVRVKDKFQVTLPAGVRRQSPVQEGDYLEVSATEGGGFLLLPQRLAPAGKAPESMLAFLRRHRDATRSRDQIDRDLATERRSWGQKAN